jgi:hypothetical protein
MKSMEMKSMEMKSMENGKWEMNNGKMNNQINEVPRKQKQGLHDSRRKFLSTPSRTSRSPFLSRTDLFVNTVKWAQEGFKRGLEREPRGGEEGVKRGSREHVIANLGSNSHSRSPNPSKMFI